MQEYEKVVSLFEYTKKLIELKYNIISDINKQLFLLPIKSIPVYEQYTEFSFRDTVESGDDAVGESEPLLRIQKPDYQPCPEPGDSLRLWLNDDWQSFKNNGVYIAERKIDEKFSESPDRVAAYMAWSEEREAWMADCQLTETPPPCPEPHVIFAGWLQEAWDDPLAEAGVFDTMPITKKFTDNEARVRAYENWQVKRGEWVRQQHSIAAVRALFMSLFNVYTDLRRESETQELMVGSGTIRVADNPKINHPLLLKRASIELNAKDNIITINDTDSVPEIYALLLSEINKTISINTSATLDAQSVLAQNFYHPLDRNNASDFLKTFVHSLSPNSDFIAFDEKDKSIRSDIHVSMKEPVLFVRKKIDGTLKALEIIVDNINETHEYPRPLGELVSGGTIDVPEHSEESSIEELLAYANGEDPEILLAKEANREQLEIAERIEQYNAVLVQGPPGTGKTHTIANLIGHFLSQGKNVLVTSHTAKALSVIQEKLPVSIRSLCVTVAGDDNSAMVRSVDGISEFMAHHTSAEMVRRVKASEEKRHKILNELNAIRKKLYQIRYSEFKPIVFGGEEYSPKEAAEFVRENSEDLSYIPGTVELYHTMPVTFDDLVFLYKCNETITQNEEVELTAKLPNPAAFPSVEDFKKLCADIEYAKSDTPLPQSIPELITTPDSSQVEDIIQTYIEPLSKAGSWAVAAAADGKRGGGYRQMWDNLCALISDAASFSEDNSFLLWGKSIQINDSVTLSMIQSNSDKLSAAYAKGKPSVLSMAFNKDLKAIANGVKINGQVLSSTQDCQTLFAYAHLKHLRNEIAPIWDELLSTNGESTFHSLGGEPEAIALRFVDDIKTYLDWSESSFEPLKSALAGTGLSSDTIFPLDRLATDREQIAAIFDVIAHRLPGLLQAVRNWDEYNKIIDNKTQLWGETDARRQSICEIFKTSDLTSSTVCRELLQAVESLNVSLYSEVYDNLCVLYGKYETLNRRQEILGVIKKAAPLWAAAIETRQGIHGGTLCPENIASAWKWKQFAGIIDELTGQPFETLQHENALLSVKLRETTADLVADKAWLHLLRTTESDLSMRQALQGWKMTVKKIGKGTGKNAPLYRRQAIEQMSQCQKAVPAWIMPIGKALDMLNPAINKFDVIIVDEASQCDLASLGILYMAKKIIIVGDDKQVSPLAVGLDIDRINALRDMYIKERIPNWHLYEAKTSLYDIAQTTFQPLMLREHFRCLPEIIGYSNKLCYDYKIKPLRDAGTAKLLPSVVNYRVTEGRRDGRKKINHQEAESIVVLIRACLEQPEYEKMSFGVISLLGDEQAALIQTKILEKIPAQVIEERQILCGNASHFQGDERDVIFLSLVDSNEGDGPLRMTGEGVDASTKQRYNVAASRAKEQLWVVHSLDYSKDLKSGDMRRDLIEYANNPNAFLQAADSVAKRSESPFEEAVGKSLLAAGYGLEQQYPVGAYRLDMVISCGDKKVALECDGAAWHSSDTQIRSDMERQTILERIGWSFIRVRGSEYYLDPEKAMNRVMSELTGFGIMPENNIDGQSEQLASDLLERVKIRANQIIDDEHEINDAFIEQHIAPDGWENIESATAHQVSHVVEVIDAPPQAPVITASTASPKPTVPSRGNKPSKPPRETKRRSVPHNSRTTGLKRQEDTDEQMSLLDVSLIPTLDNMGIKYIDNRKTGSFLWILDSEAGHDSIENALKVSGMNYHFEKRGAVATGGRPAWRAK